MESTNPFHKIIPQLNVTGLMAVDSTLFNNTSQSLQATLISPAFEGLMEKYL